MLKFLAQAWTVILYIWKYIKPIYDDMMKAIELVKTKGLKDAMARLEVFQIVTDCVQARGLEKIPDGVLNTAIELCYQIYVWKAGK